MTLSSTLSSKSSANSIVSAYSKQRETGPLGYSHGFQNREDRLIELPTVRDRRAILECVKGLAPLTGLTKGCYQLNQNWATFFYIFLHFGLHIDFIRQNAHLWLRKLWKPPGIKSFLQLTKRKPFVRIAVR